MKAFLLGALVVLIGAGVFYYLRFAKPKDAGLVTYKNEVLDLQFAYPDSYVLTEHPVPPNTLHEILAITLIRKTDAEQIPENGEGPTAITINAYENPFGYNVYSWATVSPASNFNLGDKTFSNTVVAGYPAIMYSWSGLYEGNTVAYVRPGIIITFAVTYLTKEDQILKDFESLLDSATPLL